MSNYIKPFANIYTEQTQCLLPPPIFKPNSTEKSRRINWRSVKSTFTEFLLVVLLGAAFGVFIGSLILLS